MKHEKGDLSGGERQPLTYEEIIHDIQKRMNAQKQSTIIAVNPEKIMKAQRDEQLRKLINESTYQLPDGVGVLLASRLKGGAIRERVTGIDMMDHLLRLAHQHAYRVFFYGAKKEVLKRAIKNIQSRYPGLDIAGYQHGYTANEQALIERIQTTRPHILFVALGSPKQEHWIRKHKDRLPVYIFQGVGGSFDVYAGEVKRAPAVFQKAGLEWLYRLITEPKRWKRQLALPRFFFKVLFKQSRIS